MNGPSGNNNNNNNNIKTVAGNEAPDPKLDIFPSELLFDVSYLMGASGSQISSQLSMLGFGKLPTSPKYIKPLKHF